MSKASEALQRRFGQNLSESLGVRSNQSGPSSLPPHPADGQFPRESGPDDGRTRARDAGHMELGRIVPDPDQPRKEFTDEAIERLAASLLKHGQLMPIRVRWNQTLAKWVVISGERRYRAALRAGLKSVACIFAEDGLSPSDILQEQIVENLLREDLKPVEQARAYRQLMDLHNWTAKDLAGELQVSQGAVSKSLALLALPPDLQAQVDGGIIPPATAYEVAKVENAEVQRDVARRVVAEKMTRDAVAEVVRAAADKPAQVRTPRLKASTSAAVAVESSTSAAVGAESTSRTLKTDLARIVITSQIGPLDDREVIMVLREAIALLELGRLS